VQTQKPWTVHIKDLWDYTLVKHIGSARIPPKDKTHLNLVILDMHREEEYRGEEWK